MPPNIVYSDYHDDSNSLFLHYISQLSLKKTECDLGKRCSFIHVHLCNQGCFFVRFFFVLLIKVMAVALFLA